MPPRLLRPRSPRPIPRPHSPPPVAPALLLGAPPALPAGLSIGAATGIISGTPTTPGVAAAVVVTATDSGTGSFKQAKSTAALTLTINGSSGPLTTNLNTSVVGEVGLPFQDVQLATGGTFPYTWTISAGTLPAGLSISSSLGTIKGTPTTPGATNVTVQVADSASNTSTQAISITINPARDASLKASLNGRYAFMVTGFDSFGFPVMEAGSFVADGSGNITGGTIDTNTTFSTSGATNTAITGGSYAVGADYRGKFTITTAANSFTFVTALGSVNSGIATTGYLTEFDNTGYALSGRMDLQSSSAFSTASISGGYAFGLSGLQAGANPTTQVRSGAVGELQLDGTGTVNTTSEIVTSAGSNTFSPLSGSYTVDATTGRGTMSYTTAAIVHAQTSNLIIYVISASKVYMMISDNVGVGSTSDLLSGVMTAQTVASGSFTDSTLNGTSVLALQGQAGTSPNYGTEVLLGTVSFDGTSTATLSADLDNAGTNSAATGTPSYAVAANGRLTIMTTSPIYAYLTGAGTGYAMDLSPAINFGTLELQTGTPYTAATISGAYAGGQINPASYTGNISTLQLTSNGAGAFTTFTADSNAQGNLTPDTATTGVTYTIAASGRVTLATGGTGAQPVVYIVSPTKVYLLNRSDSSPVLGQFTHQ